MRKLITTIAAVCLLLAAAILSPPAAAQNQQPNYIYIGGAEEQPPLDKFLSFVGLGGGWDVWTRVGSPDTCYMSGGKWFVKEKATFTNAEKVQMIEYLTKSDGFGVQCFTIKHKWTDVYANKTWVDEDKICDNRFPSWTWIYISWWGHPCDGGRTAKHLCHDWGGDCLLEMQTHFNSTIDKYGPQKTFTIGNPLPPICPPNMARCDGDAVEECNERGTVWEFVKTCEWGCVDGACVKMTKQEFIAEINQRASGMQIDLAVVNGAWSYNEFNNFIKWDESTPPRRAIFIDGINEVNPPQQVEQIRFYSDLYTQVDALDKGWLMERLDELSFSAEPTPTPIPTPTPGPTPTPSVCVAGDHRCVGEWLQVCAYNQWMNEELCEEGCNPMKKRCNTEVPGFEAVFAIAGLLVVAYLVLRRGRSEKR